MKTYAIALLAGVLVAGCSGGDDGADRDGDGAISAEEIRAEVESGPQIALKPGKYEQTMRMTEFDMPGLPEEAKAMVKSRMGQTIKVTHCLTEEQAKKPDADFFGGMQDGDCEFKRFDRDGNRLSMEMSCKTGKGGTATMVMDGGFEPEGYALDMEQNVSGGPMGSMRIKGKVESRRIGDC